MLSVRAAIGMAAGRIAGVTQPAHAQPGGGGGDGIEWVTIGATGNRAYDGHDPFNRVTNRGRVDDEYNIG